MTTYDITRAFESTGFEPTAFYDNVPLQTTAGRGTITPTVSVAIAGQGAAAQQGGVGEKDLEPLTGQAATAGQGALSKKVILFLPGLQMLAAYGTTFASYLPGAFELIPVAVEDPNFGVLIENALFSALDEAQELEVA